MDRYNESPVRQRMVEVLSDRTAGQLAGKQVILRHVGRGDGFNFFAQPNAGSWWAEHKVERINGSRGGNPKKKWTRAVRHRGAGAYRHAGAVAILEDMAAGHPDAQPTKVAKEALVHLRGLEKPRV